MAQETVFPRKLIWLVIVASVFVYGALSWTMLSRVPAETDVPQVMLILLAAGGCGTAFFFIKAGPPGLSVNLRYVLIWAALESVAIIGMLAAWFSGRGEMFLPYGLVSLALLIAARPRE